MMRTTRVILCALALLAGPGPVLGEGCLPELRIHVRANGLAVRGFAPGPTWREAAARADAIYYGELKNPRRDSDVGLRTGGAWTDLHIRHAVKDNSTLGERRVVTLPNFIQPESGKKVLLFLAEDRPAFEPLQVVRVWPAGVDYLRGALALEGKDRANAVRYFFRHLDSPEPYVAADASLELDRADLRDIRQAAPDLDPAKLRKLLRDPKTDPERLGLLALLLGHCGTREDARLLARFLDPPGEGKPYPALLNRAAASPEVLEKLLAGYLLLDPAGGWERVRALAVDSERRFFWRYAALRAAQRLGEVPGDSAHAEGRVLLATLLLDHPDVADYALDDLRRLGRWELQARVVALYDAPTDFAPSTRRAVLRYALACPTPTPQTAAFLRRVRIESPKDFAEQRKLLQEEAAPPAPSRRDG